MNLFIGTAYSSKRQLGVLLLMSGVMMAGCRSQQSGEKPVVTITHVPAADPGGPAKLDFIEGRVSGAKPGQQIVLYAHSGIWGLQPYTNQIFTTLKRYSTWKNG